MAHRRVDRLAAFAAGMVLLAGFAQVGQANDRGVRATMVTPSQCQLVLGPATPIGTALWRSSGANSTLFCPLLLNNIDLGSSSDHNAISQFRVHYRDPDGAGATTNVTVELFRTRILSSGTFVSRVCTFISNPTTTSFTKTTFACPQDLASDGSFYNFSVELRATGGLAVDFAGIDFPQ